MLSFIPDGLRWRGKVWGCERTDRYAYHQRETSRFPPYRRSAHTAEVESDVRTFAGTSSEPGRRSLRDCDLFLGEERCDAEDRARSTLAIETVAKRNTGRFSVAADHKLSALARCFPDHV
jgi:hypothetical protein